MSSHREAPMHHTVTFGVLALTLAACNHPTSAPTSPRGAAPRAANIEAPAPSPVLAVPLPGHTLELWPFPGFGFGAQSDPAHLIWIGHADPRALRAALLSLNGDRTAAGVPDRFPFNRTWPDAPEGHAAG